MPILSKNNTWKAPFFGKSNDYTMGRDPLGLQTTSQATYSVLLPGLTNLTNRIRYYGFYCWLLELYAKKVGNTNYKEQYKFIRRAELTIAIIMQYVKSEVTQIPGSLYAYNEIENNKSDFFDIAQGADIENKKTYWKYSSGAFGQYYSGALKALGLITTRDDEKTFICSRDKEFFDITGVGLSDAFNENIDSDALSIFFNIIQTGKLLKKDIEYLFDNFSIVNIQDTTEKELYLKLLTKNDYPSFQNADNETYFRRDTILLMLKHIKNKDDVTDFNLRYVLEYLYVTKGEDNSQTITDASYGWYYYQFNEYWHFSVATIFWAMLYVLEKEYSKVNLHQFINDFIKKIETVLLDKDFITSTDQELFQILSTDSDDNELLLAKEIRDTIKKNDTEQAIYLGIKLLFTIFKNNVSELDKLRDFAFQNSMERDGDCVRNIKLFNDFKGKNIMEFIHHFIMKNIINRHVFVAYKKMGSGVKNTLKFSYEDNIIQLIQKIEPVWTTPRIYTLSHFLQDLNLIDNQGNITLAGEKLLAE